MGNTPLVPKCRKRVGRTFVCNTRIFPYHLTGRKRLAVERRTLYGKSHRQPVEYLCPGCNQLGWTTHPDLSTET